MHADPERPATAHPPATTSTLIAHASHEVGFLDAPALDIEELTTDILDAFRALSPGAVLTVYSGRVPPQAFIVLCGRTGLDLIATIEHEGGGTTFTLRQCGDRS